MHDVSDQGGDGYLQWLFFFQAEDGIRDGGNSRIHLRLDAKIVMAGGDARDHHAVVTTSFGPRAVTIVARVVADFPPEVPRLPRVLIDERVIEIDPLVADWCPSLYLDG